jgi:hypothetical protein
VADAFHDPKHYAHADADCSGSGSGGYCATSAVARANAKSASAGSSCAGSAGAACRFSYSAHSDADLDTGPETVNGGSDCGDSGGFGGGGCGTVAYTEVDENGVLLLHLSCEGPGCRYSGVGDAYAGNLIAQGGAHQQCGQTGEGSCTIGVKAELTPDRERENFTIESYGYCVGSAGANCQGSYWSHIDLGESTVGDCSGVGSGGCHSETLSGNGNPVLSYGICIEGLACDWTATTHSDVGLETADKKLTAEGNADCTTTNAAGTGGCITAAGLEVHNNEIVAFASCEGGVGPDCSYFAHTTANDVNGMNTADANHHCGQHAAGYCGVSSFAGALTDVNLQGQPMAHHGEAIAGGTCTGSTGTECGGEFHTHVDSDRNTWSNCDGKGPGSCHGVADPWNAHSTWTPVLGSISGHIESVSPDEHRSEDFNSATTPGTVGANTHETVGRWFINVGRGGLDAIAGLPEGVVQGVKDVGTHFGNWGRAAFGGEKFERLPGESEEQYNARVWPLKHQWNQSMDMIGKIASGNAGRDLYWEPVATVSTAISGPAMILSAGVGTLVTKAFVKSLARLPGRRHSLSDQALPGRSGTAPDVDRPTVPDAVPPAARPDAPAPVVPPGVQPPSTPNAPESRAEPGTAPGAAPNRVIFDPNKFKYLFGKGRDKAQEAGSKRKDRNHNKNRSKQIDQQLLRIGIEDTPEGRQLLLDHFDEVLRTDSNILDTFDDKWGTSQVRESLLFGPNGVLKLETTWQITPDGLRFTTVKPYGKGPDNVLPVRPPTGQR